jgi:ubiquinone/menaquinone biosynthesis C-methylase UbiE
LPDASCDAALMFFVWHHVDDRDGAAQELRRVVKPGGKLFVQANPAGRTLDSHDQVTWLRSATVAEDYERLKLRSVSLFEHMSEDVAEAGFAKIEAALPALGDEPQYETSDLLVFQR